MASGGWEPCFQCENCDCAITSAQSWSTVQRKIVCQACLGHVPSDKGVDPVSPTETWPCPKHPQEPVKFFCSSCGAAICQICAITHHRNQDHHVEYIEDVAQRRRLSCRDHLQQVTAKMEAMQLVEKTVEEQATNLEEHFREVERDIKAATNEEIRISRQERARKRQKKQSKFDKEMKRVHKRFRDEIAQVDQEADKIEGEINMRSQIMLTELSDVNDRFYAAMQTNQTYVKDNMSDLRSMLKQLNELLSSGQKHIVEYSNALKQQVTGGKTDGKTDDADSASYIAQLTRKVRFVRRHENRLIGQLIGLNRSWELKQRIKIPEYVKDPLFVTAIDDDLMALLDNESSQLYVASLVTQKTRLFISSKGTDAKVWDCAPLNRNTVVCGHYNNSNCASLYSTNGKLTNTIPVPAGFQGFVAVTKDGLILSSTNDDSSPTIYFIDPGDGKLLGKMTFPGKTICGIQATPSGHIVVRTGNGEFTVVDSTGSIQRTVDDPDWAGAECGVDWTRNRLFVAYLKKGSTSINVTITSLDGQVEERDIVSFEASPRSKYLSRCAMTSMGSLVVCDGDYLLEYRRMVDFKHLEKTLTQDVPKSTKSA